VFNTDSVTEPKDIDANEFTDVRYNAVIAEVEGTETPQELVDMLLVDVKKFTAKAPQYDDMTLLCIKRIA
jgi:serine phosphatase RsbU (regulator of sigma subunit)